MNINTEEKISDQQKIKLLKKTLSKIANFEVEPHLAHSQIYDLINIARRSWRVE